MSIHRMFFGPPFPTGEPHYGHVINFVMKDIILGVLGKMGYVVIGDAMRFDVHGLPTELKVQEIIKQMHKDIELKTISDITSKIGLVEYNSICKKYIADITKLWPIAFKKLCPNIKSHGESTMDLSYMNNLWKLFGILHGKNLIYESTKIQPYSAECETCVSNFEAKQNYKMVTEKSIYVKFKLLNPSAIFADCVSASMVVWTTTPFTLFANTCVCMNDKIKYVAIQLDDEDTECEWLITSKYFCDTQAEKLGLKIKTIIEIVDITTALFMQSYIPPFSVNPFAFNKIVKDDYVTEDMGTGFVHCASAFGEDDHRVCSYFGITTHFDPTDSKMQYNHPSVPTKYQSREARDCNADIIADLKTSNKLLLTTTIKHELPHCWRTDKPLYYKLVPTININIQKIKTQMLQNFEHINFPNDIGKERMRDSLEKAPDWCLSRTRLWGTPIPMWKSDDSQYLVITSKEELQEVTCATEMLDDLHADHIPHTIIKDKITYKWCNFVFDCWYESGAQFMAETGECEMADFILEGMDQIRGWFYTLLVLSTAMDQSICYKNVIINGIVLDKQGNKFSKKLKNYSDVKTVIDKYGVDATRLYFVSSPASKGVSFKFDEEQIREWNRMVTIPLHNTTVLFTEYHNLFIKQYGITHMSPPTSTYMTSIFNCWIVNKFNIFRKNIETHVTSYKLHKLGGYVIEFIEQLNNTYCKFNKNVIKGKIPTEWHETIQTLAIVLYNTSILLNPIIPETANKIYDSLVGMKLPFVSKPLNECTYIDIIAIDSITTSQYAQINLLDITLKHLHTLLKHRAIKGIPQIRTLASVILGLQEYEMQFAEQLISYHQLIYEEGNAFEIGIVDISKHAIKIAKPNIKNLGRDFKQYASRLVKYIEEYESGIQIYQDITLMNMHVCHIDDRTFELHNDHIVVTNMFDKIENHECYTYDDVTLYIDDRITHEIEQKQAARYIATQIQKMRKENGIRVSDDIAIEYETSDHKTQVLIEEHMIFIEFILQKTLRKSILSKESCWCEKEIKFVTSVHEYKLDVFITKM